MASRKRPPAAAVRRPAKTAASSKTSPAPKRRKAPSKPTAAAKKRAAATRAPAIKAGRIQLQTSVGRLEATLGPKLAAEFRVSVRRPDDFLVFDVIFLNLKLVTGTSPKLVRTVTNRQSYLVVEFPAQSFGEEAFLDATGAQDTGSGPAFPETSHAPGVKPTNVGTPAQTLPPMPAANIRMSGPSRLAFTMPAGTNELGYDLESVLEACRTWALRLDAIAAPEPPSRLVVGKQSGKAWLKDVTAAPNWNSLSETLVDSLQKITQPGIDRMIAAAGARVGEQAATALAANRTADLDVVLTRAVTTEANTLAGQFPGLAAGEARDTLVTALSMKATESLANSKLKFGDDLTFTPSVPFLPLLLSPHEPSSVVTAIELPYRLQISPIESAHFRHRDTPTTNPRSGRTELWHTRLTTGTGNTGPDLDSKIRAIWSPDYPNEDLVSLLDPPRPFRMSLDPLDRQMLVKLMAGFDEKVSLGPPAVAFIPRPSKAHRLMLSSLGGLLDSEGSWTTRPQTIVKENPLQTEVIGLEQWRHLATLGRDHYVRVVYAGYLMPFGHHASLIKVTERKFEGLNAADPTNNRVAVLRQRFFIVVREHLKLFSSAGAAAPWFDFPFTQVEILTKVTPSLVTPDAAACKVIEVSGKPIYTLVPPRSAFWPMLTNDINTGNFRFEVAATDLGGSRITFAMPMLFIGDEANTGMSGATAIAANVVAGYNAAGEDPRRTAPTGGVSVCWAPVDPGKEGDPRLPTTSLAFLTRPATGSLTVPHFTPQLLGGQCGIRQLQRLLGLQQSVRVEYPDVYRASGFSGNPGEVFLKLPTPHDLGFGGGTSDAKSDSLGALASPAMSIQGLSRVMGPVAGKAPGGGQTVENTLQKAIGNTFDPAEFFRGAKILGGIDLSTILTVVNTLAGGNVPKMLTRELPDTIEASFHWETTITKSDPLNLLVPGAGGNTTLTMDGKVSAPIDNPEGATFNATASMVHFKVNLFGFIIIWFDALTFKASRGTKPDVAVTLHDGDDAITFGGPLEFVNDLRKFIPSNGFSDPPSLQVTPSGISASYSLSLPSITVGIFSLTNVSLGAGFSLPFDSQPVEVKFNFCTRESTFCLTVSMLGGGGFFAIGIGTEGVREIEAALEFGAELAVDLGVASGSVEIKAGVYFHWLDTGGPNKTVELTGYVRLHGELSVLGLISASLTFNLQLTYLKESGESTVYGEATLTVEIDILFFSFSVSVSCRKEFGGSPSDPTFRDLLPAAPLWADYCAAFAAE